MTNIAYHTGSRFRMAHDIFLSYTRKDSVMKDRVRKTLEAAGLRVWSDDNLTPGTTEWEREIELAIQSVSCLIVLLSPDSNNSKWVRIEITYAATFEKKIYPILIRGDERTSVPSRLINHQRIDLRARGSYQAEMMRLISSITRVPIPEKRSPSSSTLSHLVRLAKSFTLPKSDISLPSKPIPQTQPKKTEKPAEPHPAPSRQVYSSGDTHTALRQAFDAVEAGDLETARVILEPILAVQRDNADAWWIYSHAVTDPVTARAALESVVRIDPHYPGAADLLATLRQQYPRKR